MTFFPRSVQIFEDDPTISEVVRITEKVPKISADAPIISESQTKDVFYQMQPFGEYFSPINWKIRRKYRSLHVLFFTYLVSNSEVFKTVSVEAVVPHFFS